MQFARQVLHHSLLSDHVCLCMRARVVCTPQAQDVTSLTQQLQLLHVTKEFQQQVKAGGPGRSSSSSSLPGGMAGAGSSAAPLSGRTAGVPAAAGGTAAGAGNAAANKEVSSLENLLKVGLH